MRDLRESLYVSAAVQCRSHGSAAVVSGDGNSGFFPALLCLRQQMNLSFG